MIWWLVACTTTTTAPQPAPRPEPVPAPVPDPKDSWPDPTEARYAGSHILIGFAGAVDSKATRSEAEAKEIAERLHGRATADNFAALAKEHSEGPSAPRGGRLGTWLTGTMVPDFERAVASVSPGEVGPIVKTPFGWHVVMRSPIEEATVRHILVAYQGALQSTAERTRDEARSRAETLLARLEGGEDFETIARQDSDDSSSRQGGDLGTIARGQMVPTFEDAVFALDPGQHSSIVESPFGFHIIERY